MADLELNWEEKARQLAEMVFDEENKFSPTLSDAFDLAMEIKNTPAAPLAPDPLPVVPSEDERPTYEEIFLKAVGNAFGNRHPCFCGDCDHHLGKDCELAIKDSAREMVEEYFKATPPESGAPAPNLREATRAFVAKLDSVHSDYRYAGVWQIAQVHAGQYTGPTYVDELATLRAALSESEPGEAATPPWVWAVQHVLGWQANEMIHPMTCGNDSNHANLIPAVALSGKTMLVCPDCLYRQYWIPGFSLLDPTPKPGEKDQDGSGKPVAGASRQEDGK